MMQDSNDDTMDLSGSSRAGEDMTRQGGRTRNQNMSLNDRILRDRGSLVSRRGQSSETNLEHLGAIQSYLGAPTVHTGQQTYSSLPEISAFSYPTQIQTGPSVNAFALFPEIRAAQSGPSGISQAGSNHPADPFTYGQHVGGFSNSQAFFASTPAALPDLTGQPNVTDALARRAEAIGECTAPVEYLNHIPYSIDDLGQIAVGELQIHRKYTHKVGGTSECNECGHKARPGGVYQCQHCFAQICTECIERQISIVDSDADHLFEWGGTELHGAFKAAYQQRKASNDLPPVWIGDVSFKSRNGKEYTVEVIIEYQAKTAKPYRATIGQQKRSHTDDNQEIHANVWEDDTRLAKKSKQTETIGNGNYELIANLDHRTMGHNHSLHNSMQTIRTRAAADAITIANQLDGSQSSFNMTSSASYNADIHQPHASAFAQNIPAAPRPPNLPTPTDSDFDTSSRMMSLPSVPVTVTDDTRLIREKTQALSRDPAAVADRIALFKSLARKEIEAAGPAALVSRRPGQNGPAPLVTDPQAIGWTGDPIYLNAHHMTGQASAAFLQDVHFKHGMQVNHTTPLSAWQEACIQENRRRPANNQLLFDCGDGFDQFNGYIGKGKCKSQVPLPRRIGLYHAPAPQRVIERSDDEEASDAAEEQASGEEEEESSGTEDSVYDIEDDDVFVATQDLTFVAEGRTITFAAEEEEEVSDTDPRLEGETETESGESSDTLWEEDSEEDEYA